MRIVPLLVLGASLVNAAPLNIYVSAAEAPIPRLGRPTLMPAGLHVVTVGVTPQQQQSRVHRLCNKMKAGAAQIMSLAGLGPAVPQDITTFAALPVAAAHRPAQAPNQGINRMRPVPIWGKAIEIKPTQEDTAVAVPHHRHHHIHGGQMKHYRCSFLGRIHRALMTLGPWEGRAVAFVLGCGLGVLLRMFFVFAVLVIRTVRGDQEDERSQAEREYEQVAVLLPLESDAEEIFVAPPEYTDEKQPLEDIKA